MEGLIRKMSEGQFFRSFFATCMRIGAVLMAIGGLVVWVMAWISIFKSGSFMTIIGGIIFQALMVLFFYMPIHAIFIRAGDIEKLPMGEFTIIPIMTIFFRLKGEVLGSMIFVGSVAFGVFIWFAGAMAATVLPVSLPMMGSGGFGFLGGLMMMIGGFIYAVLVVVFFYLMAEWVIVLVNIANNIGAIRKKLDQDPAQAA